MNSPFTGGAERSGLDCYQVLDAASPLILFARFQHDTRMTRPRPRLRTNAYRNHVNQPGTKQKIVPLQTVDKAGAPYIRSDRCAVLLMETASSSGRG